MRMGIESAASGLKLFVASMFSAAVLLFSLAASAAPPLPGAIFTTDVDGSFVNGNTIYQYLEDVYLDGGPGPNAPQQAAGLPDGDYYFQVTDPSGKTLLSTDAVKCRRFTVEGGIITSVASSDPGCVHNTGDSVDHGGITVQLFPYVLTPNNGGVHKVWVTPVGDGTINGGGFLGNPDLVDNPCGNGCFHGFIPARSKTDNFKVGDKVPTFCINVYKVIIDKKKGQLPGVGWEFFLTDPIPVQNPFPYLTDNTGFTQLCGLVAGVYSVEEDLKDGFSLLDVEVDGQSVGGSSNSVEVMLKRNNGDVTVVFYNTEDDCKDKDCK